MNSSPLYIMYPPPPHVVYIYNRFLHRMNWRRIQLTPKPMHSIFSQHSCPHYIQYSFVLQLTPPDQQIPPSLPHRYLTPECPPHSTALPPVYEPEMQN